MDARGKARLDNRGESDADRAKRFAEIERREGETPGAKEMAMHRRPREEDSAKRAERFAEIERGKTA